MHFTLLQQERIHCGRLKQENSLNTPLNVCSIMLKAAVRIHVLTTHVGDYPKRTVQNHPDLPELSGVVAMALIPAFIHSV